jgi:hypothetical protein
MMPMTFFTIHTVYGISLRSNEHRHKNQGEQDGGGNGGQRLSFASLWQPNLRRATPLTFGKTVITFRKIGIVATLFICGGLALLTAYAWFTHFEWERTGAYLRNSFPMGEVAKDLSLWTGASLIVAALVWWWVHRRKPPAGPKL